MKETIENFKNLWPFLKDDKYKLLLVLLCNTICIIVNVLIPIISAQMIVKLTSNSLEQLLWLV